MERSPGVTNPEIVLRILVIAASLLAITDAWVAVAAAVSAFSGMSLSGGCAGAGLGLLVMGVTLLIGLGWMAVFTLLAIAGAVLVWVRYPVGTGFLFAAAVMVLLTLAVAGPNPNVPESWKVLVVVLAASPAVAVGVILWEWTARAPTRIGKVIVPVVVVVALSPVAWAYDAGVARDVNALAPSPPPAAVIQATAGCEPSQP